MADPCSTTRDLIDFGGNAEDALKRANDDKEAARKLLHANPTACTHAAPMAAKDPLEAILQDMQAIADAPHRATLRLDYVYPKGVQVCSGTAVHPHSVLTATHCMVDVLLKFAGGRPVKVLRQIQDGNDHTIFITDIAFDHWAPIVQRMPRQGEPVVYWGAPAFFRDLMRRGYVIGYCKAPVECMDGDDFKGHGQVYMIDSPGWKGDSGAGVFDAAGNVIGVITAIEPIGPTFMPMTGMPLAFPADTLESLP